MLTPGHTEVEQYYSQGRQTMTSPHSKVGRQDRLFLQCCRQAQCSEGTELSDFSLEMRLMACSSSPHPHDNDIKCNLGQISKIPALCSHVPTTSVAQSAPKSNISRNVLHDISRTYHKHRQVLLKGDMPAALMAEASFAAQDPE